MSSPVADVAPDQPLADEDQSANDTSMINTFTSRYLEHGNVQQTQPSPDTIHGWSDSLQCHVIIKRTHKANEPDLEKTRREIAVLTTVSDDSIPRLADFHDDSHSIFLAVEHRQTISLKQRIETEGSLSTDQLKHFVTHLFAATASIFMAGLAHLRICDETLHFDGDGQLMIRDLGFVHEYGKVKVGDVYASVGAKYGTDIYVAPEVFASLTYNARKAVLWACGVAVYYAATGQTERLSNLEHPAFETPGPDGVPPRKFSVPLTSRRKSSVSSASRRFSVTSTPPGIINYPGVRFEVPNWARDIISKMLITNPLKRAELIEVAGKVPKEVVSKSTRPLIELAWLDYKSHVGPLAGLGGEGELASSASSIFSGISNLSNPFTGLLSGRRRSSIRA